MSAIENNLYVIQHGAHKPNAFIKDRVEWPVNLGIGPELDTDTTQEVFRYLQRHLNEHQLARSCMLTDSLPSGSERHTLIHLHGLQVPLEKISELTQAKLLALIGHTALIDRTEYSLWPRIGIGLFFWKTLSEY